jgi:dimeric dUTPase (all-alpha-NTP-PPase superfamily)
MDKFDEMFELQKKFQERLGNLPFKDYDSQQKFVNMMFIAIVAESVETLNETPWKPWKKNQSLNYENYVSELVDVLHFFINLCIAYDISPEEVYHTFKRKNLINNNRLDNGY